MVAWHHCFDGHELEETLGVGDGQGSLICCSPWGRKESDRTEQLNLFGASLLAQTLKNLPAMQETWVRLLG